MEAIDSEIQPQGSTAPMLVGVLLLSLLLSGCTESRALPLPPRHPVSGKVLYRGQPARGFRVTFHPLQEMSQLQFAPAAITDAEGNFRLRSYEPDDGAPLGDYAVTLEWPDHLVQADDPDPKPEVERLRGAYSDPQRSRIKVTVTVGPNELQPIVLR